MIAFGVSAAALGWPTVQAEPAGVDRPSALAPLPASVTPPEDNPQTDEKIALGKQLFFDPRLSGDNTMSCASCHGPDKAWTDGLAVGRGAGGKSLSRNTPSLLNVAFYDRLTWDGRADSLEQQTLGPIQSPDEMNQDLEELERELNAVPEYRRQFQQIFGGDATRESIAKALAAFQRTLVTGPSPLDRYLSGDKQALSSDARRGLELFRGEADCVRCHSGPMLSDGQFYRLGVSYRDQGRAAISGDEQDRHRFRTPTLRNIAQTGPYMHDGSFQTLDDVVAFYLRGIPARTPVGEPLDLRPRLQLSFSDITALVALLHSMTGEPPQVEPPELPK